MSLSTMFEEVFPFVHYLIRCRRLRRRAETVGILDNPGFAKYGNCRPTNSQSGSVRNMPALVPWTRRHSSLRFRFP